MARTHIEYRDVVMDNLVEKFEDTYNKLLVEVQSSPRDMERIKAIKMLLVDRIMALQEVIVDLPPPVQNAWHEKFSRAFELVLVATGYGAVFTARAAENLRSNEPSPPPYEEVHRFEAQIRLIQLQKDELRLDQQLLHIRLEEHLRKLQKDRLLPMDL